MRTSAMMLLVLDFLDASWHSSARSNFSPALLALDGQCTPFFYGSQKAVTRLFTTSSHYTAECS